MDISADFVRVEKPASLIPILEKRMPDACSILNMVLLHEQYGKDIEYYRLDYDKDSWIIVKWYREDFGFWMWAMGPKQYPENGPKAEMLRTVIKRNSGEGKIMDWLIPSVLWMDKPMANAYLNAYVAKIDSRVLRVKTERQLYMTAEHALNKLDVTTGKPPEENVRVGSLDASLGVPFIVKFWHLKHVSTPENLGKVVEKSILRGASAGVYVKEEGSEMETLACAGVVEAGQIGMLHTDPKFRKKGYARLCITYMLKQMAKENLYPCISGDVTNPVALKIYAGIDGLNMLDEGMAMIWVGTGDWISY